MGQRDRIEQGINETLTVSRAIKRALTTLVAIGVAALTVAPAQRVVADDETADTEIKLTAPLDAADCGATPPTITVLGLTIDISAASIGSGGDGENGTTTPTTNPSPTATPDDVADDGGSHGGGSPEAASTGVGCSALIVGQTVEVKLASDVVPLAAAEVKQDGGGNDAEIKAPIQSVDAAGETVTVLGLVVDVSAAELNGADDQSDDGNSEAIDLTQLIPGQFVELKLESSTPPLSAREVELKNFANQVEVELRDAGNDEVDDVDEAGNPVDDVDVEVAETVAVQVPAASTTHRVKKIVRLHTSSNGRFTLSGLPTGRATISVLRSSAGQVSGGRHTLRVRPNSVRSIRIRLRHSFRR